MQKLLIVILTVLLNYSYGFATTIRGKVTDAKTGEALAGITIEIKGAGKTTVSGLDGSYELKGLSKGEYTIMATGQSYAPFSQTVTVEEAAMLNITMEPQHKVLQEVTVSVGRSNGATDASARQLEKVSDNVENILSTHQLAMMPDVTVASVLRRVSGVTVDRGPDGEGRYPVIRGMDKRYNYTLINGIKIPSPDDKNRYVPMDIFPSEMLQRLEVIKSLTPDMEADATGGVMNLVMKDAPNHFTINAQGALGYAQMAFDQSFISYDHSAVNLKSPGQTHGAEYMPTYSDFSTGNLVFTPKHPLPDGQLGLTIGNRYLNQRLGIVLSGSYQSTDRITRDLFFPLSPQPSPLANATAPDMTDEQHRTYYTHEDRMGLHAKLDYRFDPNNRISFYTVFMQLNSYESRLWNDTTKTSNPDAGTVSYDYRSRTDLQSIYNATLQGQHAIGKHVAVDWSAVYSHAGQQMPDRAELVTDQNFNYANNPVLQGVPELDGLTRIWQHNSDQDVAGYLNIHYRFDIGSQQFDIGIGGMARHKDRTNYYNEYDFNYPSGGVPFTNIQDAPFTPKNDGTPNSPNSYDATENIAAGYGEIRWKPTERWNILAGIRFENTYQSYNQYELSVDDSPDKSGKVNYVNPLPSLQVKYQLTDKSALHLAYFNSITRPGFFEIVPYQFPGEYYTETGNVHLVPSTANNVDLRYELFPGLADQLLVGAFFKRIVNPIEYVYARPATSESVIEPENVGTATNFGAELVYTHYFNKFGVSLNYTYTHSNIPTVYKYYYAIPAANGAAGTDTSVNITRNRPLQGQAAHIGNLSLLYKDPKTGIELQLATIYTGRHITYLSQYGSPTASMDYWQRGALIEDFSGEKTLGRHFSIYVKLNNLFNTADVEEMDFPPTAEIKTYYPDAAHRSDRTLVEKKTYGQTYLAGLRYHF